MPYGRKHKHTIEECIARYESSLKYGIRGISKWSGWSVACLQRTFKSKGIIKGSKLTEVEQQAEQKIMQEAAEQIAEFDKEQLDIITSADKLVKAALNPLIKKVNSKQDITFNDLKTLKISTQIMQNLRGLHNNILHIPDAPQLIDHTVQAEIQSHTTLELTDDSIDRVASILAILSSAGALKPGAIGADDASTK